MRSKNVKQKTLFDFVVNEKENKTEAKTSNETKAQSFEELLQKAEELFRQHLKCLKKDEVAASLRISTPKAIEVLNTLVKLGIVRKRLNDDGELVYCSV